MSKRVRSRHRAAIEALEGRTLLTVAPVPDPVAYPTYIIEKAFGNTLPTTGFLAGGLTPAASPGPTEVTPEEMLQAYGVNNIKFGSVVGNGAGQTIAIIDAYDDPNAFSDLTTFDTTYNLPVITSSNFKKLNETGGTTLPPTDTTDPKPDTWELEESLDIEWAHVIAPAASIILYEANSSSFSDLVQNAVNTARKNPSVSVVSMSFGASESQVPGETAYDTYFTTPKSPAHQGVTFLASTGDSGSPGGYPAYSPNVIAVGGTTLLLNTDGSYNSETAWSGSGGGTSTQESVPKYQIGTQTTGMRTIPDISMDASPSSGVPVYDTYDGSWFQVGGTSLASPMSAALIAIADQGRVINGFTTLDGPTQTLPTLYSASKTFFHDVTSGSNVGFSAGPGYDEVSGIGTPVANLLDPALAEASSSVALSSSKNPSNYGQSTTFTATVTSSASGTPSGTVTFKDAATVIGTGTLNASGVATWITSTLVTGAHTITATYGGDSTFASNLSTALTQTVNHLSSSTALASSGTPSKSGQSVTFTATVTGSGTPTGTVTFKDGSTTLGTGTLNGSGVATYTTTALSVASHSITAAYGGDSNFAASTSSTLTQVVQQAASSTVLGAAPNPSVIGQVVTLTATVALSGAGGGTPTGTVTFKDGSTTLGSGTLNASGVATYTTSALALGSHALTGSYGGSTNFTSSASTTVSQVINQASSVTALTSTANPSVIAQSITLTATVTAVTPGAGTPTGTVTFMDGSSTLGTGTLNASGVATYSTSSLTQGSHSITATYGGSTNYAGSTSSTLSQSVNLASSSTGLVSSINPSVFGQSVTLTATVTSSSPGTPTGTVTFKDGSSILGIGTLNASDVATFSTSSLSVASHSITANYGGDSNFSSSASSTLAQTVNQAGTTVALASSANPAVLGQSVTLTATVAVSSPGAGTPSGTVTFMDGSSTLGTGTLNGSGVATYSTSTLSVASHSITASYGGDTNFVGSSSSVLTESITSTAAAAFVGADTTTQGTWTGVYGSDGYSIFNGASSLPSYAQVSATGASQWTWASGTGDVRALQTGSGSGTRIASCDYSNTSLSLNVNLSDGQTHQVALYMTDWDSQSRAQTVTVVNAGTNAVLDSQSVSSFTQGTWLVWNISGNVRIVITQVGGANAVVDGVFFAAPSSSTAAAASFVTADTTTQGTWTGVYGSDGYSIFNGASSLPSYAQVSATGASQWTWASGTGDVRALQTGSGSGTRIASCDYSNTSLSLNVNLSDGQTHQVALYMTDWDSQSRAQTVTVVNAGTNAVLDSQSVSSFTQGTWLVWNISGNVRIVITQVGGANAVVDGVFFAAPSSGPSATA